MIAPKNILVATDFGPASDAALLYGRELARLFGATLHVLHVVIDVIASAMVPAAYVPELGEAQQEAEERARERLRALLTDEDRRDLGVKEIVVTSLSAANAILIYANDALIDLIVVGTHGRGGVAHLLLGSVAEKVVRSAPCPVLSVRHPEREFVRPDALEAVAHA